ncbi:excalibur calcium-binding domain-containing protein [Paenarthrobacter sp. Z7-10]|uniref:excalibur calcium-binding domain-containing protein n=1 Tax=Paenarthrobacter sp. Z7-10 TaxID=2787635 RepID=UPI0022A95439|nr:excalibur calcium-binding domain-containing protein [Paenarthrobacter sp. Z7-10]
MNKRTAGITLAAVIGFTALSAAPAMAVTGAYPNCSAAAAVGVYNIPAGAPGYGPHLDSDNDGIGCEKSGVPYTPEATAPVAAPVQASPVEEAQVGQMPVGGADTGVAMKSNNDTGVLAIGGGLVLVMAAGGTYVVRRRHARQA